MITIYHLSSSRSERVIWLMEELGLPYELERFSREPTMLSPPGLRAVHPMGKSPIVRDGETVLIESGAILEYIVNRYGGGRLGVAVGSPDYARYLQWMHFAEGSAMTQFLIHLYLGGGLIPGIDQSAPIVARVKEGSANLLKYVDSELASRPYFAGDDFTAADIMMMYCLQIVTGYLKFDLAQFPNIVAWKVRIEQRPGYQKAMAIANPPKG